MSLGLPGHLASAVVNEGIARGTRTVAAIALVGATSIYLLLHAVVEPTHVLLTLLALVATGAALSLLMRRPSLLAGIIYLLTGTGAIVAASHSVGDVPAEWGLPAMSVARLTGIAVVMVGGVAPTRVSGIVWTLAAAACVTGAGVLAAVVQGSDPSMPWMAWGAASFALIVYTVTGSERDRRVRLAQPDIHRAARDEKLAEVRSGVERRAAALLHDTVLGSLAAIANGPVGALRPSLARTIERDLDTILGQDWVESAGPSEAPAVGRVLACVVSEVEDLGLEVSLTGDVTTLERLSTGVAHELALAVKQALVNVHRHAGVSSAEVVVVGYPDSLTVMVIDDGVGFDPAAVGSDRIGLRTSVVDRIDAVGGSVRLWSTRGRGTSVLISLPVEQPSVLLTEAGSDTREVVRAASGDDERPQAAGGPR